MELLVLLTIVTSVIALGFALRAAWLRAEAAAYEDAMWADLLARVRRGDYDGDNEWHNR